MGRPKTDLTKEFNEKTIPIPECGCLVWTGSEVCGYGKIMHNNKQFRAHRLAFEIEHGAIPKGMSVLHKCDVKLCVNTKHLYIGDHTQNMKDRSDRGRSAKGGKHGLHKLTDIDVLSIRSRILAGDSLNIIAKDFNVKTTTICDIKHKRSWMWL